MLLVSLLTLSLTEWLLHVGHEQPQGFSCTPNHLETPIVIVALSKNPMTLLDVYFLYRQLSTYTLN